jgi:hypothetical protein
LIDKRFADIQMRKKNKIFLSISGVILIVIIVFGSEIEEGLACLAYYDQCTAKRIEGLTAEQCFKKDDDVAFLHSGICLVKSTR